MASASGNSTSRGRTNTNKNTSKGTRKASSSTRKRKTSSKASRKNVDIAVKNEVMLIVIFAAAIFTFLCVIGVIRGAAATGISNAMFGMFGLLAYLVPIIIFLGFAFGISNKGNTVAVIKMISSVILIFLAGILAYMFTKQENMLTSGPLVKNLYQTSAEYHTGGGVLFGSIAHGMYNLMGFGGTLFVVIVLGIISIVFITEKSFLSGVKNGGSYLLEAAREDAARMKEYRETRLDAYEDMYEEEYQKEERPRRQKRVKEEKPKPTAIPDERVRRMDKKARGVASSSVITFRPERQKTDGRQDIHEIVLLDHDTANSSNVLCEDIKIRPFNEASYPEELGNEVYPEETYSETPYEETAYQETSYEEAVYEEAPYQEVFFQETEALNQETSYQDFSDTAEILAANPSMPELNNQVYESMSITESFDAEAISNMPEPMTEDTVVSKPAVDKTDQDMAAERMDQKANIQEPVMKAEEELPKKYSFPSLNLLKKGEGKKGDSSKELKETALRLQQTLQTFGVRVTITDISQGPSVTRYEMQPEQGVKVSKIVGLTDDIKLNLAATDIRIEAPIPGKAAVGIEVPNKENSAVALRDLLESDAFQNFPSNLAFAVGKDIAGQVVVTDIAKMPHVLIAGATGSGKSVCINTIIMSILYKANPADVKLIMIDPKVVELSVYNGIPHLMVPVVTDPKKASAALNWGVSEMNDRYKKFADLNVRDLKGYNKAAEEGKLSADGEPLQKMPQIVIIVDELADLMMVASGEVEESICRLAQLARACGIHLVIATQRPSVDVITGLIKANMPSRIAFSVSSGVDSRTILDMNGAEKLLGKGDMLFYPQGYPKPARVQGAFVSDPEVSDVVDFLKNQMIGNTYNSDIEDKIKTMQSSSGSGGGAGQGNDSDAYFADAGKFVIEKEKASIGMLQRVFKIGFNRAARIMDQLEDAGVVGAEEGTKPRRILMSMEQFQNYLEEKN